MSWPLERLRNIGIIAHIDAGKTTTTERILFYAGASHRMGDVDDGTTTTDFDPEEQQRGITIYSAAVTCHWRDCRINIIDTPGHVDFTAEVERSLRVLDGGVVIFSAREGVEAQSETVWRQANKYRVPRICFINKMDRIGASFERTFEQIEARLAASPVAMQIPVGRGSAPDPLAFRGIVDLVEMKFLVWEEGTEGQTIVESEIPEDELERAEEWRAKLIDKISSVDDAILNLYVEDKPIPVDELRRAIRGATLRLEIQPVFCGSSLNYVGVQKLLDGVTDYLPSPAERPPVEGTNPQAKKGPTREVRNPSVKDPFCGLVFKIVSDAHGDLCFVRVYSGVLKSRSRLVNPRTGKKEMVTQLVHVQADRREKVETESADAGDIVGVIGPKEVVTGDTLCDTNHPVALESIVFPEPVISMAVEPESSADRKKLADTLQILAKQDPTFRAKISEETGQTIISGMGELHLEVIRHRMERDYKLNVRVHKPRVSYRETIRHSVDQTGEFNRTVSGVTQYARVRIRMEPVPGQDTIALKSEIGGKVAPAHVTSIEQSLLNEAQGGGTLGYPMMQIKMTILDAEANDPEVAEVFLQNAAVDAVRKAVSAGDAVLLEPVMKLEVVVPDDFLGNIHADLNARRATVLGSEQRGDLTAVSAEAPLAQLFGYSTQVRSLSQGRASYSMEPLKYQEAPKDVLEAMLG
jgi:elongation factor G